MLSLAALLESRMQGLVWLKPMASTGGFCRHLDRRLPSAESGGGRCWPHLVMASLGVRGLGSSPAAEKVQDLGLLGLGGRGGAPPALN